jgi:O6-methylguanine-DNA--protein-cysteine methyltransferase
MKRSISTDSPIGRLTIVEATKAIVAIRTADDGDSEATPLLAEACRQLGGYSGGAGLETKRELLALEAAAARWL